MFTYQFLFIYKNLFTNSDEFVYKFIRICIILQSDYTLSYIYLVRLNMINSPSRAVVFEPLTPEWAERYLQAKPPYLEIWKNMIEWGIFEAQDFCNLINELRIKRIDHAKKDKSKIDALEERIKDGTITEQEHAILKKMKEDKSNLFFDTVNEVFRARLKSLPKNSPVSYRELTQLIWSLSNVGRAKTQEIAEVTDEVNKKISEDFLYGEYLDEITGFRDDEILELITDKDIANTVSESEKDQFTQDARSNFLHKHKEEIDKGEIDIEKLEKYLHSKKLM